MTRMNPSFGGLFSGCWLLSKRSAADFARRLKSLPDDRQMWPAAGAPPAAVAQPAPSPLVQATKQDGIATIPVVGILTKYSTGSDWLDDYLELTPTLTIRSLLDNAIADPQVQTAVMLFDTPGGDANGTYELAEAIEQANKIKPVHAIVSDTCTSGGQLLASMCDSIRANDKAWMGGMGVYRVLCDDSKFWSDMGVSFTVVSSGGMKGQGADGRISQELIDDHQREVDSVYELFINYVARGRGMDVDAVRQLADGRSYIAREAQRLGLIDEVASIDASIAAILDEVSASAEGDDELRRRRQQQRIERTPPPQTSRRPAAAPTLESDPAESGKLIGIAHVERLRRAHAMREAALPAGVHR